LSGGNDSPARTIRRQFLKAAVKELRKIDSSRQLVKHSDKRKNDSLHDIFEIKNDRIFK
jgi:hypothetical protein